MNELIRIESRPLGGGKVQTVNARELHAFLEVGRDFTNWITDRIREYEFLPDQDYAVFAKSGSNPKGGRRKVDYALSVDMAKELAMVERNAKGREARRYFIAIEKAYRSTQGSQTWVDARSQGKLVRKLTTDIIAEFIEYAKRQGSENADKYYVHFSKLVNTNLLELEGQKPTNLRDQLNTLQLHQVSVAEGIITKSIVECIGQQRFYKDVYQIAKQKIQTYASTVGRSKLGASERQTLGLLGVGA